MFLLWIVWLAGCTSEMADPPAPSCNTPETVSFRDDVAPVFRNNCLTCHNNNDQIGSISLEGYENVKQVVASNRLLGAISHTPGFSPMPQGGIRKLDNCAIQVIRKWIDNGTLDN